MTIAFLIFVAGIERDLRPIDPRYHSYVEMIAAVDSIVTAYPAITRLDTLCLSTRDSLWVPVIKVSDSPALDEDEPAFLFTGVHHAEELLSGEVCLYLLRELTTRYAADTMIRRFVDENEIWVVPLLNPEGHNLVTSLIDTMWRKNKRDNNGNGQFDPDSDGVDLNRNYDFNWILGGSGDPPSENYRGPYPFSENETGAIRDLALENRFVFEICYHNVRTGQGELVYYPWRWGVGFCIDYPFIRRVADTLASVIVDDAGGGTYVPIYGYATEGTARNWLYGVTGAFAFTIEVSRYCYPPGEKVDSICIRNLAGPYYLMNRCRAASLTGTVEDSLTGQPIVAEVRLLAYYDSTLPPRTSALPFGRYRRIVNPGTYSVQFLKPGYDTVTFNNVIVNPGQPTVLNVRMYRAISENSGSPARPALKLDPVPCRGRLRIGWNGLNRHASSVRILDAAGRLCQAYENVAPSGEVVWTGKDRSGAALPEGVYFVRIGSDGAALHKIVFLR